MTRADLIAAIARRFPKLMAKDAEISVKEILEAIGRSLALGERVEIRGFGVFSLNYRPARIGRNPKSREAVAVAAKSVPYSRLARNYGNASASRLRLCLSGVPPDIKLVRKTHE